MAILSLIGVISQLKEVLLILFYIPFYNVSFFIIASQYQINMRINHYLQKSCENRPVWGARQNDFRTFCMSGETENMCQKLEEVINT